MRNRLRQILTKITPEARQEKSKRICQTVLASPQYRSASVVMAFLSMQHEVDTTPIILNAWQNDKTVVVPRVFWQQKHMIAVEINSLDTGVKTEWSGLRNPICETPVPYADIDLTLTPGLGFDRRGNRLGRGGSYYDRFFMSSGFRAAKWAVAFGIQIQDEIPYDDQDVPVDAIITEEGFIDCSGSN